MDEGTHGEQVARRGESMRLITAAVNANPYRRKWSLLLLAMAAWGGLPFLAAAQETGTQGPRLNVHPLVFSLVQGWLSDGESPVVTEINLDAVDASRNQFDPDEVKLEGEWTRSPGKDGSGFLRYRVLKFSPKGQRYTVEYQENGGGSLTLAAVIEVSVGTRKIGKKGDPKPIRILRVLSYQTKSQ